MKTSFNYLNSREKRINFITCLCLVFVFSIYIILSLFFTIKYSLVVIILILSVLSLVKTRKNPFVLVVNAILLYSNYSVSVLAFINTNNYYYFSCASNAGYTALCVLAIFNLAYFLALPRINYYKKSSSMCSDKKLHILVHIGIMLVLVFIILFGYQFNSFGERGIYSPIWGYFPLIVLLGLFFSKNLKVNKIIYFILSTVYALINLICEERVYVVQLFFILCVYFFPRKLMKKIPILVIAGVFGYMFLSFIGNFRNLEVDNIFVAFVENIKICVTQGFSLNTSASAFNTGVTFVEQSLVDSATKRTTMFMLLIASCFLGGSLISNASLPNYTRQFFYHSFGGLYPLYSFYYLSYCGVVIFAVVLAWVLKKSIKLKNDDLRKIILTTISCSTFSWYLYTPVALIRNVIFVVVLYYALILSNIVLQKIKENFKRKI